MTASLALSARLELTAPALRAASAALWAPAGLRARCVDYLQVMHGVIRASVPLMVAAVRRCAESPGDPVAVPLAGYLMEHIADENRHDAWLLEDLAAAGRDPSAVLGDVPGPAVARLVGAQYYWIEHGHPVALLGYMAVLEGNQPTADLAADLTARSGLPAAAFRTLHLHAVLDGDHRAELDRLLDRLPLRPEQERAVTTSALHTVDAFAAVLASITDHPPTGRRPR